MVYAFADGPRNVTAEGVERMEEASTSPASAAANSRATSSPAPMPLAALSQFLDEQQDLMAV